MRVKYLEQLDIRRDDRDQVALIPALQLCRAQLSKCCKDLVANDRQQFKCNEMISVLLRIMQKPAQHRQ